LVSPNKKPPRN